MENLLDLNNLIFNGRQIFIIIDQNGDPWFKAKEVCDILEYKKTKWAISEHVRDKYKVTYDKLNYQSMGLVLRPFDNVHPYTIFINEPGLYSLIMKSKMKEAQTFQEWVFEEVLPSIRKTGEYKLQQELKYCKNQLADQSNQLAEQSNKLAEMNDEIQGLRGSNMVLSNFKNNTMLHKLSGYVYIMTTERYALENYFKIGITDKYPTTRQGQLNTSHIGDDQMYLCFYDRVYNMDKTEQVIKDVLKNFRDRENNEFIRLHYKYLLNIVTIIVNNLKEPYQTINSLLQNELANTRELRPIVPKPILETEKGCKPIPD